MHCLQVLFWVAARMSKYTRASGVASQLQSKCCTIQASDCNDCSCNALLAGVVLGCGAHGKVYKGQWRGQPVAVKVLYHSGLRAAARAVHETDLMLRACHKNVVQTHHVLMWQRAKAVIDDCVHDWRGDAATPVQQQQQVQQHMLSLSAAGDHSWQQELLQEASSPAAAAAAAADGEASPLQLQPQQQSERRFSNLHIDNSNANGNVSACGVMELSAADADAAGGWMRQASMFVDDDEDELETQTCEWRLVTDLGTCCFVRHQ
jgi:hypothetical protein